MVIGQSVRRIDALGKVTGETPYPGDIDIEGQLWMRIKFSDRAHARVLKVIHVVLKPLMELYVFSRVLMCL